MAIDPTDLPRLAMPVSSEGSDALRWVKEGLSSVAPRAVPGPVAVPAGGWGLRRPVSPSTSGTGVTGEGAPSLPRD